MATTARLLRGLVEHAGAENVTVVGDSAGGGLALAATQRLRDEGAPVPKALVLVSPWLDLSVGGEDHRAYASRDRMLGVPGLAEAGRLYAGDLDVADPRVSPIHGDLRGLPPLTVFSGTHDLLHPDSLALAKKAAAAGVPIDLRIAQGFPHNHALFPTPEGRAARALAVAVARSKRPR